MLLTEAAWYTAGEGSMLCTVSRLASAARLCFTHCDVKPLLAVLVQHPVAKNHGVLLHVVQAPALTAATHCSVVTDQEQASQTCSTEHKVLQLKWVNHMQVLTSTAIHTLHLGCVGLQYI
jgi:hypothetical protein